MNNPNSKISDEIKEKIEKETVSEIEKEIKEGIENNNSSGLVSKLDPKVKEEISDLTKDSKPVVPKNDKNIEQGYDRNVEQRYNKDGEQGYNKKEKGDTRMNRENQMASDLSKNKREMSNKIDNDLLKRTLPVDSAPKKSEDDDKKEGENKAEQTTNEKSDDDKAQELTADKKADVKENTGKGKIDVEEEVKKASKIKLFFNKLLKNSILQSISTFSLSLFYSYIHLFLCDKFPQFFGQPGGEWVPDEIQKSNPKEAKKIGDKVKVFEKPALCCACILHLLIIVYIIVLIYFILFPRLVAWTWLVDKVTN